MSGQWRRARFKINPLSITLFIMLLVVVGSCVLMRLPVVRLLAVVGVFTVSCAFLVYVALSFKLRLSNDGIELRAFLSPTRTLRWDEIRSFFVTDDYRVILKIPGARELVVVPGTYSDPEQVVHDIGRYLGQPRLQETDFERFASQALVAAIIAAACSIAVALFASSIPLLLLSYTITWAAGLVLGFPLGAYLLKKRCGPATRRRGFRLWASIISWWGGMLSMTLGAALPRLVGLGPAPDVSFVCIGLLGYAVGSFGVFAAVSKLRAQICRS